MLALMVFTGINPDFHLSINQYFTGDMVDMYNISPQAGVGMNIPLSTNRSFRVLAGFLYDRGEVWDYRRDGSYKVYSDLTAFSLETSWEFSAPFFEKRSFYWGVGPVLGVGGERIPVSDTAGTITVRTDWGTGLGGVLFLGARLIPLGKWFLGIESGVKLLALHVEAERNRYPVDLSGFSLTLTFGRF
jgi:hypothetical protein